MFIQLSVHPVTQLVLIQSSNSFCFFLFCFFLFDFFFFNLWSLLWWVVGGLGRELNQDLGVKRIFVLDPTGRIWSVSKSELESGMKQFQHKQAQKFSLLADWKRKKKNVKMEYDEFQHNGAPRPWGLSFYFALILFVTLETCSSSWDLKWTHLCVVLVLPYSFQVL